MEFNNLNDIRTCLRQSSIDLSKWKLIQSARWSAEALNGLYQEKDTKDTDKLLKKQVTHILNCGETKNEVEHNTGEDDEYEDEEEEEAGLIMLNLSKMKAKNKLSLKDQDLYLYANTLFDNKEYDRCSFFLRYSNNPCMKFLYLYAKYLSWDMKSQENLESELLENNNTDRSETEKDNLVNTLQRTFASSAVRKHYSFTENDDDENKIYRKQEQCSTVSGNDGIKVNIPSLLKELNIYFEKFHDKLADDHPLGFALLYYLKGVFMKLQDLNLSALQSFIASIKLYPYNWGAWLEIIDCVTRADEVTVVLDHLNQVLNPDHIMLNFFKIVVFQDFFGNNTGEYGLNQQFFDTLDSLLGIFPNFAFLKTQQALISYELMDYVNSEKIFSEIIKIDPYRLEDLDTYSNILYVMQDFSKLANLAQMSTNIDRFRPETCCIVANYYSSKQDHEKAIMYFRRALTLNKNNTSAWTLMGHEFIELKNTHAAIESYRKAVEVNPKDFKAWYGLGQTYEIMGMYLYSLYYFQKSCSLRPLDKRIWNALGNCYEKLNKREKIPDAIRCFERSLQLSGVEDTDEKSNYIGSAYKLFYRIASLYEKLEQIEQCKYFMMKCCVLDKNIDENKQLSQIEEVDKANLWMAKYEFKNQNYKKAYLYANQVNTGLAKDIEDAKIIALQCTRFFDTE